MCFCDEKFSKVAFAFLFFFGGIAFIDIIDFNTAPSRQWEPSSSNSFRSCT